MKRFLLPVFLAAALPTLGQADTPAIVIGTQTDEASHVVYTVSTNGQPTQNLSLVQLWMSGTSEDAKATKTTTSATTLRTGKQKTVAQVTAFLSGVLQKFLAGAPAGTSLGKLGSLEKGGEVEFVAESIEVLRFDFKSPTEPVASKRLSPADAKAFAAILEGK